MYRVTYYFASSRVTHKDFDTFEEACDFSRTVKTGDVIEIKLYKDADEGSVNH